MAVPTDPQPRPVPTDPQPRPARLDDVRGWFSPLDQLLFAHLLGVQEARGERGDLLEIGVFMGKSAIFLGQHLQDGERFTVCDLFESDAPDRANTGETSQSYPTLTRAAFEANYLSFHDAPPRVLQGPSSVVPGEVEPGSCRFVHIDGSHLYEHVRADIGAARDALLPDGVVVIDDFRSEHTPGVSIAAWEAVLNRGLRPVCLTTQKLYGTWGDPAPLQEAILAMARARAGCGLSRQAAAGERIIRLKDNGVQAPDFPFSRHYVPERAAEGTVPADAPVRRRSARSVVRRAAIDLLPPVVTRAVRQGRARRRAAAANGS